MQPLSDSSLDYRRPVDGVISVAPGLGSYSEMCCCSWMAWDFLTLLSHIAFADVAASIYGGGAEEVRGGGL
jgi:hypothetical protein